MSNLTANPTSEWRSDYPIGQSEEHRLTRRQFAKFACGSAVALGAGWVAKDRWLAPPRATAPMLVAQAQEIPVGGYKLFSYPTEHHPCILVRLAELEFAAYSQSCTHLQCPVHYQHDA